MKLHTLSNAFSVAYKLWYDPFTTVEDEELRNFLSC